MRIPEGLTEDDIVGVITKIARRLAPKFTFASYDVEDIEQEAFLIGIAGLEKYDPTRPLENFMYTHISNRLKTFKRDNYYRLDYGSNAQKSKTVKDDFLNLWTLKPFIMYVQQTPHMQKLTLEKPLTLLIRNFPLTCDVTISSYSQTLHCQKAARHIS